MDIERLFRMLATGSPDPDFTRWHRAGALTKEEMLKSRALNAELGEKIREIEVYRKKIAAVKAGAEAVAAEWWSNLYKAHGLTDQANYHVTDEGHILVEPRNRKDGPKVCVFCYGEGDCRCGCHDE